MSENDFVHPIGKSISVANGNWNWPKVRIPILSFVCLARELHAVTVTDFHKETKKPKTSIPCGTCRVIPGSSHPRQQGKSKRNCADMRHEIRNILKEFKPEIVISMSSGTLTCLVDELALDFNDEDRQKIQCDATNNGPISATDGLLDCLKCYDDCVFTKFMQFLKFNSTTKELFIKISDTCRSRGLESVLPQHEEKEKPALICEAWSDVS